MIQRSLKYSFQDEQVSEHALMVEGGETVIKLSSSSLDLDLSSKAMLCKVRQYCPFQPTDV